MSFDNVIVAVRWGAACGSVSITRKCDGSGNPALGRGAI